MSRLGCSFLILIATFFYCCRPGEQVIRKFKKPHITNSKYEQHTSVKFKHDSISEVFPRFVGKYKLAEKIDINSINRDTFSNDDFVSPLFRIKSNDTLDVNGFELEVDYKTTIKYCKYPKIDSTVREYYPVYFINSTANSKIFPIKDSYIFGIQEAQSLEHGYKWRPIEAQGFDFCGNGHWAMIVHPNEFVVILMKKYEGDFTTEIRVRVRLGESIYVSKSFEGTINQSQFQLKENAYLKTKLNESSGEAASWLFHGSMPNPAQWLSYGE